MTKRWNVMWVSDWRGQQTYIRLIEISVWSDDGIALGVVLAGLGFAIYRADEPDVYGDGGVA